MSRVVVRQRRAKRQGDSCYGGRREGLDCGGYRLRTPKQRRFDAVFLYKKKKKSIEPVGSSSSPVGPPIQAVRPRFNPNSVQMTGSDQNGGLTSRTGQSGPVFKTLSITTLSLLLFNPYS